MPDRDRFGGSERDYLPSGPAEGLRRSGVSRLGDLPGGQFNPSDFWNRRVNRDTTTVPEGFRMEVPSKHDVSYGRMRPTGATNPFAAPIDNNPMRGANIGGGWNMYEGGPEPRRFMPMDYMGSGEYLSSRFGGGIDDAAGMNDDARGMIEGAGFDVVGGPGMVDERMKKKLWGIAVNKFPPGTPDTQIQQEWEKLKRIYFGKTYGYEPPTYVGPGSVGT